MNGKNSKGAGFVLVAGTVLLAACGGSGDGSSADATIAAYRTEVAQLEAENQELSTAVAELTTLTGIGQEPEPTATEFVYSVATPGAVVGDGSMVEYQDWEIQLLSHETRESIEGGETTHIVTFEVVNTGSRSTEFPYSDFIMSEPYGAEYPHRVSTTDYSDNEDLVPGVSYERRFYFTAPTAVEDLFVRTKDGSLTISLSD